MNQNTNQNSPPQQQRPANQVADHISVSQSGAAKSTQQQTLAAPQQAQQSQIKQLSFIKAKVQSTTPVLPQSLGACGPTTGTFTRQQSAQPPLSMMVPMRQQSLAGHAGQSSSRLPPNFAGIKGNYKTRASSSMQKQSYVQTAALAAINTPTSPSQQSQQVEHGVPSVAHNASSLVQNLQPLHAPSLSLRNQGSSCQHPKHPKLAALPHQLDALSPDHCSEVASSCKRESYFHSELISSSMSANRRGSGSFHPLMPASTFIAPTHGYEKLSIQQPTNHDASRMQQYQQYTALGNQAHWASETDLAALNSMSIVRQADQLDIPSGGEFTPKRDQEMAPTQAIVHAHLSRIISVSPYQKCNSNAVNTDSIQTQMHQNKFTRPRNRMLASTAPAARPNVINIQTNLQQPDQSHEFHPIREGRQMSLLFGSESSAGNNSFHNSLPINDVSLQPTSRAFSTTGIRQPDEHSSSHNNQGITVDLQNEFENRAGVGHRQRMQRSSLSKQSLSVAGDTGLAMMLHDESMELLDEDEEEDYQFNVQNHCSNDEQDDPQEVAAFQKFINRRTGGARCLKVVSDRKIVQQQSFMTQQQQVPSQQHKRMYLAMNEPNQLSHSRNEGNGGLPSPQVLPKSRPRQEVAIMQPRMRLKSHFTSIDRGSLRPLQTRADLIADTSALQTDQAVFALEEDAGTKTTQKFKLEPRIKRQAQSIVNRRRSLRINMQAQPINQSGMPGEDTIEVGCWRDNKSSSNFLQQVIEQQTEPAPSICQSCHEQLVIGNPHQNSSALFMKRDGDIDMSQKRMHHNIRQLERSLQNMRNVQIMRFGDRNDTANQSSVIENEDRRSLSHDRIHYATSSFSSDRSEATEAKKQQINMVSSRSRRHDRDEDSDSRGGRHRHDREAESRFHHSSKHYQKDDKWRYKDDRSYQHRVADVHTHHRHYKQLRPSNSPSQSRQSRNTKQRHISRLQDRQPYMQSGGHSSKRSYFSSTKFPNIIPRNMHQRTPNDRYDDDRKHKHRSRSRSRRRSYSRSHSRSRSKTSSSPGLKRKMTLPATASKNLNLQEKDSQSAVHSSRRSNQKAHHKRHHGRHESSAQRRSNTVNHEHTAHNRGHHRDNYYRDTHSSNYSSRRSRRHDDKNNDYRSSNHLHLNRRMTHGKSSFFENQRHGEKQDHRHGYGGTSRRAVDELHYHGMKDAFYSSKRRNNAYLRQQSSRGKGSFKTQKYRHKRSRSRNLSSFSSRGGRSLISSYSRGPPISSFRHSKKFPSQHSSDSTPVNQPAASHAQVDRSKDAGHFEWRKNMFLEGCAMTPQQTCHASQAAAAGATSQAKRASSKYLVVDHLGDGTFGRALKCVEILESQRPESSTNPPSQIIETNTQALQPHTQSQTFAIKVVRAVPRYAESAKFEAQILQDLHRQGGCDRGIVYLKETFINRSKQSYGGNVSNMCLVFEPLGKSLYDFIKDNGYKGFEISQVREIAIQALNAIEFLHSLKLTHTDLKPENILLKSDNKETITDEAQFPIQVQNKRNIYGSQKCSEVDDSSYFSGKSASVHVGRKWCKPVSCEIKIIDFGGATYEHERHTLIINTRQYRAPEVILENLTWNEKSDIWSMACILVELYTGELFFDTDENLEHLAMIEKQCGPIPLTMAQRCGNDQIKRQLHRDGSSEEEQYVRNKKMRLRWPAASLRASSRQAVSQMLLLDDIINDKWGEQHRMFKDLLKFMLKIDPKERPSASECLNHYFFNDIRKLSKSTEKTQVSTADHQFESPRHKPQQHQ